MLYERREWLVVEKHDKRVVVEPIHTGGLLDARSQKSPVAGSVVGGVPCIAHNHSTYFEVDV